MGKAIPEGGPAGGNLWFPSALRHSPEGEYDEAPGKEEIGLTPSTGRKRGS